jgi:hypothetical protein
LDFVFVVGPSIHCDEKDVSIGKIQRGARLGSGSDEPAAVAF